MEKPELKVEMTLISELVPYTANPKLHTDKQIQQIMASIDAFGFNDPLGVDEESRTIIEGHGRYEAAKRLGLEEVPVIFLGHLSEPQRRAYAIAHNKLTMNTGFDLALLKFELADLQIPDFDLELTGFDLDDIAAILGDGEKEGNTPEDQIPEAPESITKEGDLWILGEHRLLCGDSTQMEDVDRLMNGEKADLVFTDPPYGVDYSGGIQFSKEGVATVGQQEKLKNDDSTDLYSEVIPIVAKISKGPCYVWFAGSRGAKVYAAIEDVGEIHALIIWVKNGGFGALNANYKHKHEPCLYWKPTGTKLNFIGATTETTVWEIDKDGLNKLHPTQKPVLLAETAIRNHSGNIVADLFLGSGSTLIACEKTSRKCYGMEIDPHYCDIIIKRWEEYTGQIAEREQEET
ncbi:MAG: site-specific DNA-methyltransferase [Proteobacteria bacterium]|nr:site-specific DNA-methyltransferase [Pseudomonadota bacterium]